MFSCLWMHEMVDGKLEEMSKLLFMVWALGTSSWLPDVWKNDLFAYCLDDFRAPV